MALANRPCMAQCDKNMQVCMGAPASVPGTGNPCLSSASCASSRRLPHLGLSRGRARPHVCVLLTLPRTLFISESLNIKLHAVDALGCMRGRVCANPRRRLPQGAKRVLLWHLRGVGLGQTRRMLVCRSRQLANLLRRVWGRGALQDPLSPAQESVLGRVCPAPAVTRSRRRALWNQTVIGVRRRRPGVRGQAGAAPPSGFGLVGPRLPQGPLS
eukprot:Tamp_28087.p1 GENE.Tamp_28087~~Tamp_28087.p1  ORF type:complete len:243 (+),score=2.75 Tamp_28087:88-729(+)